MRVILDDFYYKGKHYDRQEFDLQGLNEENYDEEKITAFIVAALDNLTSENESN